MDSLPTAIRRHFVEMLPVPMYQASFPPTVPSPDAPFPPVGPLVGSPPSTVLRGTPTPYHPSPWVSFPSPEGYPPIARRSLPSRWAPPDGPGLVHRGVRPGLLRGRWQGLPGSWGAPCERALLLDPGEAGAPGLFGAPVLPSAALTASALAFCPFEALSHGP